MLDVPEPLLSLASQNQYLELSEVVSPSGLVVQPNGTVPASVCLCVCVHACVRACMRVHACLLDSTS